MDFSSWEHIQDKSVRWWWNIFSMTPMYKRPHYRKQILTPSNTQSVDMKLQHHAVVYLSNAWSGAHLGRNYTFAPYVNSKISSFTKITLLKNRIWQQL